jgi:hypothetical protein
LDLAVLRGARPAKPRDLIYALWYFGRIFAGRASHRPLRGTPRHRVKAQRAFTRHISRPAPRSGAGIKRIKIYKIFILFLSSFSRQKPRFPLQFAALRLQIPLQSLARVSAATFCSK